MAVTISTGFGRIVAAVDLPVTEPSVYFGELSNDYAFVKTKTKEFHYPKGEDDVYTTYDGTGGVSVGSFGRKLLFALRFQSMKMLLSDDLTSIAASLASRIAGVTSSDTSSRMTPIRRPPASPARSSSP